MVTQCYFRVYLTPMLTPTQIENLNEWIEDTYGSPEQLAHYLDLAEEMLFYVEGGSFQRIELQDVATTLRGLRKVLG